MSSVATTTGNAASENTLFSVNEKVKQHINNESMVLVQISTESAQTTLAHTPGTIVIDGKQSASVG